MRRRSPPPFTAALCTGAALCLALACPALAQWPTTVRENLPIAARRGVYESDPTALPLDNGRTLIIFYSQQLDNCYQILDRYGQSEFAEPQRLTPGLSDPYTWAPLVIPDGTGGVFAAWYIQEGPQTGFYAQRLDSQGNRLWGDAGINIFNFSASEFGISLDGVGGLLIAAGGMECYIQRLNSLGQSLWGDTGALVCNSPDAEVDPTVANDGQGGAFVTWRDYRYGGNYGRLYMQHLDANGNMLWSPSGVDFLFEEPWIHQVISDGQGGFILHAGHGAQNAAYRVGPNGNTLWLREFVSWYVMAQLVEGEPGYFYLGFVYGPAIYGQRMDMLGNFYWPSWGSGQPGALMANLPPGWSHNQVYDDWAYQYPFFLSVFSACDPTGYPRSLFAQGLDSLANWHYGENGTLLANIPSGPNLDFFRIAAAGDGLGGTVAVFATHSPENVYAKHANADGSLGPPPPLSVPPNGNPPVGPSLSLNQFRYSLPGPSEVEAALYDILGREQLAHQENVMAAGSYTLPFNTKSLPSGIYLLRLKTKYGEAVGKLVILR